MYFLNGVMFMFLIFCLLFQPLCWFFFIFFVNYDILITIFQSLHGFVYLDMNNIGYFFTPLFLIHISKDISSFTFTSIFMALTSIYFAARFKKQHEGFKLIWENWIFSSKIINVGRVPVLGINLAYLYKI